MEPSFFPDRTDGHWAMLGHIVFPRLTALAIGRATSPFPFPFEVAGAHPGIGAACLIVPFYRDWGFRAAGAMVACGFLDGAALGHLVHIAETGNMATGTAGPVLYADIVTPPSQLVLLALTFRPVRRGA